jgi:predicted nucleotidyltransferase
MGGYVKLQSMMPLELAEFVTQRLSKIEGVVAVVLGGSHARGDAKPTSDIDLAMYYHPEHPLNIAQLRALADELEEADPKLELYKDRGPTELGGWGPFINGGAWLNIQGQRVDWLYSSIAQAQQAISDAVAGKSVLYHQPGHPHGFHTHMFAAQVHTAKALHDPTGTFGKLKEQVLEYPPKLQRTLIKDFFWQSGFALQVAEKSAKRAENFYVAGCLFQSAACLVQVLFALNKTFFLNEKGSVDLVETFALKPEKFAARVHTMLGSLGTTATELEERLEGFETLLEETRDLCKAQNLL